MYLNIYNIFLFHKTKLDYLKALKIKNAVKIETIVRMMVNCNLHLLVIRKREV